MECCLLVIKDSIIAGRPLEKGMPTMVEAACPTSTYGPHHLEHRPCPVGS